MFSYFKCMVNLDWDQTSDSHAFFPLFLLLFPVWRCVFGVKAGTFRRGWKSGFQLEKIQIELDHIRQVISDLWAKGQPDRVVLVAHVFLDTCTDEL